MLCITDTTRIQCKSPPLRIYCRAEDAGSGQFGVFGPIRALHHHCNCDTRCPFGYHDVLSRAAMCNLGTLHGWGSNMRVRKSKLSQRMHQVQTETACCARFFLNHNHSILASRPNAPLSAYEPTLRSLRYLPLRTTWTVEGRIGSLHRTCVACPYGGRPTPDAPYSYVSRCARIKTLLDDTQGIGWTCATRAVAEESGSVLAA